MKKLIFCFFILCFSLSKVGKAQSIVYADVNKADVQRMNFEIIGKLANNYLIYKEIKGNHRINVFNESMLLLEDIPVTILPKASDLLDITFYSFDNYAYLLYQFQKGSIVYFNAARVEANGKILNEPITLDTTIIAYKTENKIYTSVKSNDGNKIMLFKINKKDRSRHLFKTRLYDFDLNLLSESSYSIPMDKGGDYMNGYSLANNGDFAFVKYHRLNSGNISDASLIIKPEKAEEYQTYSLSVTDLYLDDIKLKIDNANNRYLLSSFYSDQKRGNISGLYNYAISADSKTKLFETKSAFDDEFRKKMKGKSNSKSAFNDFFINSIIIHENGGFTIGSEALYTTNSGGMWDRWNYWGSPYYYGGPYGFYGGWGGWGGGYWSPYYYYSPFLYRSYWWGTGYGSGWESYHAGNIGVFSFDQDGNKTKENIIYKSQSESNTDATISYQVLIDGDKMHFLINHSDKISDLDDVTITEEGSLFENDPIPAKDKNVDFMPRYGKQVGARTMILPFVYKKNISFAKVQL